jgi:hypothetical protein
MTDRPKTAEQARREQRLGAALRENLKRRKAQAKNRAEGRAAAADRAQALHDQEPDDQEPHDQEPHDSAGFAEDKRKR